MKRVINRDVINNIILSVERDLSIVADDASLIGSDNALPYFILTNKHNDYAFAPWSARSVSEAVFMLAKSLCLAEDDSFLLKDMNNLQLVLWFYADHKTLVVSSVNVFICDLNQLIREVDDV